VNRNEYAVEGRQMSVKFKAGERYFDLYRGEEIKPERDGDNAVLSFPVEGHGYGAILATSGAPDAAMTVLMAKMKTLSAKPLLQFSQAWAPLPQHQTAMAATKPSKTAPKDMVAIPGGNFDFRVQGIEVEGSDQDGVDIAYPWENSPRRFHRHQMMVHPFFIDRHNITNAEFKAFIDASHYQPRDPANFLKDWKNGAYPDGWAGKPVTWVSLEDARAYAAWAGKRLPHEWEWQYAAQGADGRAYPWGAAWKDDAVPKPNTARSLRGPDDTLAHPGGASPFGVLDLVGNVWQWTDEYMDEHTRSGILRGGSYYQPQGSLWYFPDAYRNDQHGKYLLMAPSKDRAATVGFRCVVDAE
jgi:formylglycine-generating enzyme required for sulfatase activity